MLIIFILNLFIHNANAQEFDLNNISTSSQDYYAGYPSYQYPSYNSTYPTYYPDTYRNPAPVGIFQPSPTYQISVPPSQIRINNFVYDASLSGFRRLIEENHRDSSPDVYKKISERIDQLERNQSIANWVHLSGLVLGISYIAFGPLPAKRSWCGFQSRFDTDCLIYEDNHREIDDARFNNAMIGFSIWLAGLCYAIYKQPGRSDFLNLINEHNKLVPNTPIQMNLGIG